METVERKRNGKGAPDFERSSIINNKRGLINKSTASILLSVPNAPSFYLARSSTLPAPTLDSHEIYIPQLRSIYILHAILLLIYELRGEDVRVCLRNNFARNCYDSLKKKKNRN